MATEGIGNIFDALSDMLNASVYPDDVLELIANKPEPPRSFVGAFLKLFSPPGFAATFDQADLIQGLLECLHRHWVSEAGPRMKHGIWDHFKGGVYLSEDLGMNAAGELEVRYLSLLYGTKHQRRCSQWNEVVQWPDGQYRSRFIYRGVNLESSEPPSFKVITDAIRTHVEEAFLTPGEPPLRKAEE